MECRAEINTKLITKTVSMESFGKQASQERRKKKESNRRAIKEERKNRLREKAAQKAIAKDPKFGASDQKVKEMAIKQK